MDVVVSIRCPTDANSLPDSLVVEIRNDTWRSITLIHCQITARAVGKMIEPSYSDELILDNDMVSLPSGMAAEFELPASTVKRFTREQNQSKLRLTASFIDTHGNGYQSEIFEFNGPSIPDA